MSVGALAAALAHVPTWPGKLQRINGSVQAVLQQTPLAQKPVTHCEGVAQAPPKGTPVLVGVAVGVGVRLLVAVTVGVSVGVPDAVTVGVTVGVDVGPRQAPWQNPSGPKADCAQKVSPVLHLSATPAEQSSLGQHSSSSPFGRLSQKLKQSWQLLTWEFTSQKSDDVS